MDTQASTKLMAGVQHDRLLQLNGNPEKRTYQKPVSEDTTVLGRGAGKPKGQGKGAAKKTRAPKTILSLYLCVCVDICDGFPSHAWVEYAVVPT